MKWLADCEVCHEAWIITSDLEMHDFTNHVQSCRQNLPSSPAEDPSPSAGTPGVDGAPRPVSATVGDTLLSRASGGLSPALAHRLQPLVLLVGRRMVREVEAYLQKQAGS